MGYETKLIIGKVTQPTDQFKKAEKPILDGESFYFPYEKGEGGRPIKTGVKESWFWTYAEIDLCKCGGGEIDSLPRNNKDEKNVHFIIQGDQHIYEDRYGDKFLPLDINMVYEAIKKDSKKDEYRRFKWALSLLESMKDEKEGLKVILFGY
jgi:hypothetical protein